MGKKICVECGGEFYSRSRYIICEKCRNMILLGYDVEERENEPHTADYYMKSFKQLNGALLEEIRRADRCGKSYGQYRADIREVQRRGKRK